MSTVQPRIRVRVQSDDEPGAYPRLSDWWTSKDTAAIRAGVMELYVIEIIDGAGRVLNDVPNRIGFPGFEGTYDNPDDIHEPWLSYFAADHWTPEFGISPGDLIRYKGKIWSVISYDQDEPEYGDIGANSGFLFCQSTTTSARRLIWIGEAETVKEITA